MIRKGQGVGLSVLVTHHAEATLACDTAGLYPVSNADFDALASAVERLTLNDASVAVKRENSTALGAGFRCG